MSSELTKRMQHYIDLAKSGDAEQCDHEGLIQAAEDAKASLEALQAASLAVVNASTEWETHETIDGLREALGMERLDD